MSQLTLVGCATLIAEYSDSPSLKFTSDPKAAKIETDNYGSCLTPCELTIDGKKDFDITVTAQGYEPLYYRTQTSFNFLTALNLFWGLWGVAFMGVDYYNDEFFKLEDDDLFFELDPSEDGGREAEKSKANEAQKGRPEINDAKDKKPVGPTINGPANSTMDLNKSPEKNPPPPKNTDEEKPLSASEKKRLSEIFSPQEVHERLVQYYGNLSSEELRSHENRIYKHLKSMEDQGESMDLDEAVRRDWFSRQGSGKK